MGGPLLTTVPDHGTGDGPVNLGGARAVAGAMTPSRPTVPVLVPVPVDEPFDYVVPEGAEPPGPGRFVRVSFGRQELVGVVWERAGPPARAVTADRLKPLLQVVDAPPMPGPVRALVTHVARETLAPLGSSLRLALPVPAALEPWPVRLGYRRPATVPKAVGKRAAVLAALPEGEAVLAKALAAAAGVGIGVLHNMAKAGLLEPAELLEIDVPPAPDPDAPGVLLTPEQARVAAELRAAVAEARPGVTLLEGVPGAGKTEVYFEAVAEALRRSRRVLVLLPEIALSAQWLERFRRRFGAEPAVWHSALTSAQRRRTWRLVAEGRVPVVVGARSALFLPLADLGLVVVDEEHDASFKQGDGVPYNARDMAVARARSEGCPVVLATATPAVETAASAGAVAGGPPPERGWRHLLLPARHGGALMPAVRLVDLRREQPPRGGFMAPALRAALAETLAAEGQSLLFINRRGYAPLTLCRTCGYRLACSNCSAWLVAHRLRGRLQCHHCGLTVPTPQHCPSCGVVGTLAASGPGVERLAEELRHVLPEARVAVMTSDTVPTARAAAELVTAVERRQVDVLIGTQIIAKGHHFPALTLVGVVDADLGLGGGDLRAAERTFQLLYQVAGRAGRESRPGRVLVQTHLPDHPVMQALAHGDKDGFLAAELVERRDAALPPYGRLAALILAGRDAAKVKAEAQRLARAAPRDGGALVLGPAPAPLALLRGRYRERLLVKAEPRLDLPGYLRRWLAEVRLPGAVSLQVDVDPYSFM
jgi:primosomal protein N' (replication factor Y) (superfamily II helicase)